MCLIETMQIQEVGQIDGSSDDVEVPDLSKWESITWLCILTCLISVLSGYLVNAIEVDALSII